MNVTKTEYGKIWQTVYGYAHVTFFNSFKRLMEVEDEIVMELINLGYHITKKEISIVGGGVSESCETMLDLNTGEYHFEVYHHVEHGVWKLKFKLKKGKWLH